VVAQAAYAATSLGLPAIAPAIREHYGLTLTQVGVVLAAGNVGALVTLLLWGLVADLIGERAVVGLGQAGTAAALVWAASASSFGELVIALACAGALGAGVNAASGRAVMAWFDADERGLALGIRQMAVPLGGAVGAVVLLLLNDHIGLHAAFEGLAIGCFGASLVGALLLRVERAEDHSVLARPLRDPRVWRICIASSFYVITQMSLLGFFVLFLHDHRGVSTGVAAAGLAVTQVLGGIARIAVGRMSDRLRMRIAPLRSIALGIAVSVGITTALLNAPVLERPLVHGRGGGRRTRTERGSDRAPADLPLGRCNRGADRLRDRGAPRLVADRLPARRAQPACGLRAAQSAS
jgi:sugar phosphate permease